MALMSRLSKARELFESAFEHQKRGDLETAIELYLLSIAEYPTAEAHTYLGWTYSFQGKLEEAITECKKAIVLDPSFGNPYNDIGAYLIELGRPDDAVEWLEKATVSERYESYQFPWYNLGRVYISKEMYRKATECFETALDIEPAYEAAQKALEAGSPFGKQLKPICQQLAATLQGSTEANLKDYESIISFHSAGFDAPSIPDPVV